MGRAWRKRVLAVALIGLAVGAVLCGCSSTSSVTGTYVNQDDLRDELELRRDGTYYLSIKGIGLYGRYEVKGDTLTLIGNDGSATRATIKGSTLTFPEGSVVAWYGRTWVKGRQSDVSSVAGTYVNREGQAVELLLLPSGAFHSLLGTGESAGRYEVKGDTLTLIGKDGSAVRATIKGDTITFPEGSVIAYYGKTWVKGRVFPLTIGTIVTYMNQEKRGDFPDEITLRPDGTFRVSIAGAVEGRYEVKGSTLTLTGKDGWSVRATIKGDTITFPEGSVIAFFGGRTWVKE